MQQSGFEPTPEINRNLARAFMWTLDGRTFEAPTFQIGMAPAGSMYTTVNDLGHFVNALFGGGRGANGSILSAATLEQMWTPQDAGGGQKTGYGIGFGISTIDGHRTIGHGGAIYGFATQLSALPDDKLGVVVVTTKDAANAVTNQIAEAALHAMLAVRQGERVPQPEITSPADPALARRVVGRYVKGDKALELFKSGGKLWLLDARGGFPAELRSTGDALVADGALAYGTRIVVRGDQVIIDNETFERSAAHKPPPPPTESQGLIGEYGWDHDVLYILEKDGKLWALIEWFEFDPLEKASDDVFRFPDRGLYAGEQLVFTRDSRGRATRVVAANVAFQRRPVGPEDGAPQLRITPVRPVNDLLAEARAARPPTENREFRKSELVELTRLDPGIHLDIRYASTNNLLGTVLYTEPRAFLQRPAAEALVRAHRKLKTSGYGLLVHDGYRPWYVTKLFWDATPQDKKVFVADPTQGSRHNRGAAVDLTLYDLRTGNAVEMVSTYDETTNRAYADYPGGTSLQRWHRQLLRETMETEGFSVYPAEWWHFDYKDWQKYAVANVPFDRLK
jgi:D-alanyl-D-alanine dipeptidase